MSAAKVNGTKVTVLDGKADAVEVVTEQDVQDATKLARGLGRIVKDLASLLRRFSPPRVDFEDVAVSAAGATVSLEHGFGGRVRWWVVDWVDSGGGGTAMTLNTSALSTSNVLVLASFTQGIATIRVEAAG